MDSAWSLAFLSISSSLTVASNFSSCDKREASWRYWQVSHWTV